jgi:hypothetical protein
MTDEIATLEAKNKALSNQLDKITDDLFKTQEIATDLKNKLDEKKHSEQLAGWAIDRAIETIKLQPNSALGVTDIAQSYCDWIMGSVTKKIAETMQ